MEMEKEAIEFLKEVLEIQSVNGIDDERNIAYFIQDYFMTCGVDSYVQEIDNMHANVVAKVEGETDEWIVWNGHMDTVPYGDITKWDTNPSHAIEKEGNIYARGASDMKSGLAGMIYVLGQLKKNNKKPQKNILFIGTCDEEKNGLGATYYMEHENLRDIKGMLIGEPTSLALGIAQKGCLWIEYSIRGVTSHGAYPQEGYNAIEYGIKIIEELRKEIVNHRHQLLGVSTLQLTKIEGGIANNMTPDKAKIAVDIRLTPDITIEKVIELNNQICEKIISNTGGKIQIKNTVLNARDAIEIEPNHMLTEGVKASLAKNKVEMRHVGINYFTDASILAVNDKIPVLLFGPGNPNMAHKPNEMIEVECFVKYIKCLENIALL